MRPFSLVPAFVLAAALVAGAPAQIGIGCQGDDGFNPGCCQTPQPNLPSFPAMTQTGTYACIQTCVASQPQLVNVVLSAPSFVLCDYAILNVNVSAAGVPGFGFGGLLVAKYARTWLEFVPGTNIQRQVWRFLVNGDLPYLTSTIVPTGTCPVPPCAQPPLNLPVHFVGSIDYALECGPTPAGIAPWSVAMNLSHMLGCWFHAPFSRRPLPNSSAHLQTSYHLVTPSNFVFGPAMEPQGALTAEDTRSSEFNFSAAAFYQCYGEAQVGQGALLTQNDDCYTCTPILPIGPAIYHNQTLTGFTGCGPITVIFPFNTIPLGSIFPTGLVAQSLGTYVGINPNQFPVGRQITVYLGAIQYDDPCNQQGLPIHAVTGVGHISPNPAILFGSGPAVAPVFEFTDLQNMLEIQPSGPLGGVLVPTIGGLFVSEELWNLNTL